MQRTKRQEEAADINMTLCVRPRRQHKHRRRRGMMGMGMEMRAMYVR